MSPESARWLLSITGNIQLTIGHPQFRADALAALKARAELAAVIEDAEQAEEGDA